MTCVCCGETFDEVWRWCPDCGTPVARLEHRRDGPPSDFTVEWSIDLEPADLDLPVTETPSLAVAS